MLIELKKKVQLKKTLLIEANYRSITSNILINRRSSIEQSNNFKKLKKIYIDIEFALKNDFIYYLKKNRCRLCIFKLCEIDIFRLAHDDNQHFDRYRCYQKITNVLYISRLFKKFRFYLKHCFDC